MKLMILLLTLSMLSMGSARRRVAEIDLPTQVNSNTIRNIVHTEKRFTLYNSRRLTGECLQICAPTPTSSPQALPTTSPTGAPTVATSIVTTVTPTEGTSAAAELNVPNPTSAPISPTSAPVSPTGSPTASTTSSMTFGVQETRTECKCETNDDSVKQSFKCGNDVYVCPGITEICSETGSQQSKYYKITETQCDMMKLLNIGDKCLKLPEYNLNNPKSLSNRVCYDGYYHGMKVDSKCDFCNGSFEPYWQPLASRRWFF